MVSKVEFLNRVESSDQQSLVDMISGWVESDLLPPFLYTDSASPQHNNHTNKFTLVISEPDYDTVLCCEHVCDLVIAVLTSVVHINPTIDLNRILERIEIVGLNDMTDEQIIMWLTCEVSTEESSIFHFDEYTTNQVLFFTDLINLFYSDQGTPLFETSHKSTNTMLVKLTQ